MFLTKNLFKKYFGAILKKQGFLPQDYFNEEKGFHSEMICQSSKDESLFYW